MENLSGRVRVDAVRSLLDQAHVHGEIGFIRYVPKEHRLSIPVSVPGRETTFDVDISTRTATITDRDAGLWDAVVMLHKAPGSHLADIRMNWVPMRIWRWLADATVYLLFFISASGIYLWIVLRSERRVGVAMLVAGAVFLRDGICPCPLITCSKELQCAEVQTRSKSGTASFTSTSVSTCSFSCGCSGSLACS